MSLLSASVRAPLAPVASPSSTSSVEGAAPSRASPRANLLRRSFRDSLKKSGVQPTCHKFDRVSRALLTSGGWSRKLEYGIMGACCLLLLMTILARNSMCPIAMLIHRLQVFSRQDAHLVRSVPVQVAHELINAGHRCLDVRTQEEFIAGHVDRAVNIPYLLKVGPGMTKNHRFLDEVKAEFGHDDEIIVDGKTTYHCLVLYKYDEQDDSTSCQSGRRSMMAAAELRAANFTGITDMGGGYLAWKEGGLPYVDEKKTPSHSV